MPMTRTDLLEILRDGESSSVEFKRDDVHPDKISRAMSAMLNFKGGWILLGVEDDGRISGLTRTNDQAGQWVMNIAQNKLQPLMYPSWSCVTVEDGLAVGVIGVPRDAPGKPYRARVGNAWRTFFRAGASSREASREEEGRLWQQAGIVHYEKKAVPGADLGSLEQHLLANYFSTILRRDPPSESGEWNRVLSNLGMMEGDGGQQATVVGLLVFGRNPNRWLPQAGVTAVAFPSTEKGYATIDEEVIRGPLVSGVSKRGRIVEPGVIDRTISFVMRNVGWRAWIEGGRRRRKTALPSGAVREAIVNAVAHRDYTIEVADVEVSLYPDRLEVISPGQLPNGMTVENMKEGMRAARNGLLKDVLRDYRYVEHFGMGVRNRIILAMRDHNGTEVDLVEDEQRFTVRLWKDARDGRSARGASAPSGVRETSGRSG